MSELLVFGAVFLAIVIQGSHLVWMGRRVSELESTVRHLEQAVNDLNVERTLNP